MFFRWFMFNFCLISLFKAFIIHLLNLPTSFLGFICRNDGLFWKFSLWSLRAMRQLISPLMSMLCSTSLSFKKFPLLILIFFLMLLFGYLLWKLRSSLMAYCIGLCLICMLLVLSGNVIVLSDLLIIFMSFASIFKKWFRNFLIFTFFTRATKSFSTGTSLLTFHRLIFDLGPYHTVWLQNLKNETIILQIWLF